MKLTKIQARHPNKNNDEALSPFETYWPFYTGEYKIVEISIWWTEEDRNK